MEGGILLRRRVGGLELPEGRTEGLGGESPAVLSEVSPPVGQVLVDVNGNPPIVSEEKGYVLYHKSE